MVMLILLSMIIGTSRVSCQISDPFIVLATNEAGTFAKDFSQSQLGRASLVEILFVFKSNMDTSASSDIYSCADFSVEFGIPDLEEMPLEIQAKLTKSVGRDLSCDLDWGDGESDSVDLDSSVTFETHEYAEPGVYAPSISCDGSPACPSGRDESCVVTDTLFDAFFRDPDTPMVIVATQTITIHSYMQLSSSCASSPPEIFWTINEIINGTVLEAFTGFTQPNTSVLILQAEVLPAGDYLIYLEIAFPTAGADKWKSDYMFLRVVLPELITFIEGGDEVTVRHGEALFLDATYSRDPLTTLEADVALEGRWSFLHWPSMPSRNEYLMHYPQFNAPSDGMLHDVHNGSEFYLLVDTNMFPPNSVAMARFTVTKGDRVSSKVQLLSMKTDTLERLALQCVYNCNKRRDRKFIYDKIEFDSILPETITDISSFTFSWRLYVEVNILGIRILFPYFTSKHTTGYDTRSLGLKKGALGTGGYYKIVLRVSSPDFETSEASVFVYINQLPYGGTCGMDSLAGVAARDWLTLNCIGWMSPDDRYETKEEKDNNPTLTFDLVQATTGAFVPMEPLLKTRAKKTFVILKLGDPLDSYKTTLLVRVSDMYGGYTEVPIVIVATPAFAWYNVTPTDEGGDLVRTYSDVDFVEDAAQLTGMGKHDMIISLIASVCSHLHLVELPIWTPPVPYVTDTNAILDLSPNGTKELGTIGEALVSTSNNTVDPATITIQEVLQSMTSLLREVVERSIINGTRGTDKLFTSMVTNAFTNIAYKDNFINLDTKTDLVFLSLTVGTAALEPVPNSTEDQSAVLDRMAGEIYHMSQAVVNSVVPNKLKDARTVSDFSQAQNQLDDMIDVIGDDFDLDASEMSPAERAYLYMQMQAGLAYDLDTTGYKKQAKEAADMSLELSRNVQQKLKLCKMCSNAAAENTDQLVKKNSAETIKTGLTSLPDASFRVDGLLQGGSSDNPTTPSSVSAFEYSENVFMYDDDLTSSLVTSTVLRLDVKTEDSYKHPGSTTFDQVVKTPDAVVVEPFIDPEDASMLSYHRIVYKSKRDNLCLIIRPHNETLVEEYEVYVGFMTSPSILEYDVMMTVSAFLHWQVCLLPDQMQGHQGITYIGVKMTETTKNIKYNFTLITVSCMVWDEAATKWHTDKCEMEWIPDDNRISCYCNDVTDLTFGNSFFVAPNNIDFASVFLKFSPLNQAAVMGCLGGILLIYIVAIIFLVGIDRRDVLKWGVTPLRDNLFGDNHFYVIKVFTGMRRGAGTRSRIAFILTGDKASTGPREMFDGLREEFPTGSVQSFFMATKVHLGQLEFLYVWHNNAGQDDLASWYLNQVVFYDVQTKQTYTFVGERWLSVEDKIDAKLTSSAEDVPVTFESRFFFQTRDRLSESHMWVSIAYRPQTSTFSRVQRATCALVYIFLTMIANAMYYNPAPDYEAPALLEVGPLRFTSQQIFISIVSALITTPAVMFVIFIFKRSKRRPIDHTTHRKSCCHCCYRCPCAAFCSSLFYSRKEEERRMYEDDLRSHMLSSEVPDFKGGFYLPFWFLYVGWFIAISAIITSGFFIMLYSMEWGKQKSEEWLSTVLLSMLQSMLFIDPLMVICLSFVFACIFRSMKQDTALDIEVLVNNYKKLRWQDKEGCDFSYQVLKSIKDEYNWFQRVPRHVTPPMKGSDLEREANEFKHKDKLSTMLRDIVLNIFLIFLVFSICYGNKDDRSFHHVRHIENAIVNPSGKLFGFESITTHGDLFRWVNETVLPELFPEFDVTGEKLHWTNKVYMNGGNHFRLGPPRLRQLRVIPEYCTIPLIGTVRCYDDYSILGEESEGYCIGWAPGPCPKFMHLFNQSMAAWNFTSAFDTWGIPLPGVYKTYGGGGYIAAFDINLSGSVSIINELAANLWLDRQTRGVVLEFTLYSASTNIFIYNAFLCEFLETGGVIKSRSIYPVRVYSNPDASGVFLVICQVIFVIYLFVLLCKICIRIYKERCGYFHKFWQVFDIILLFLGIVAVAMFFMRLGLTSLTISNFQEDMRKFVSFGHIVFWDQLLTTFLGFFLFLVTIRILEVFSTSKRVQALVRIFSSCGWDLASFGVAFIHIFIGFAIFGHFLFGSHLDIYIDVYNSMTTLFLATLGVTQFSEIEQVKPILAKFFYLMYIMTVIFFTLTIFMSILGGSIDSVMHDTINDEEQDLVDYMMKRVKVLVTKPTKTAPPRPAGGHYFENRVGPEETGGSGISGPQEQLREDHSELEAELVALGGNKAEENGHANVRENSNVTTTTRDIRNRAGAKLLFEYKKDADSVNRESKSS